MKNYTVRFEQRAKKVLQKMDKQQASFIMAWIARNLVNTDNPRRHGKALTADHTGKWRYRVGEYRLICDISDETITILILEIGHRSKVYK